MPECPTLLVLARTLAVVVAALASGGAGPASTPATPNVDLGAMLRAGDWIGAEAAAASLPDGVAVTLVRFRRLLAPGMAGAGEIHAFMVAHPGWPMAATLTRRRDEAISVQPEDALVMPVCDAAAATLALPAARLRCADAYAHAGRGLDAARLLRRAWVDGPADAAWEARVSQLAGGVLTPDDQWRRFDRLAWTDPAGARRQAVRLAPSDRARAEARLALKRDDPSGSAMVAALTPAQRDEPALVLERLRALGRAGQDNDELTLWREVGTTAERAVGADRRAAFWIERNVLARRLLRAGAAAGAYAVTAGHAQTAPEQIADAEFFAGFVALRRLADSAAAQRHFATLAQVSTAPITQARAHFWLARTAASRGDAAAAEAEYRAAARHDTTFYGQLAALAVGEGGAQAARLAAASDPAPDPARSAVFAGRELARAAVLLAGWGEARLAASFVARLADEAGEPAARVQAAQLAQALCPPDVAVAIARRLGRDGIVLVAIGWPQAADVPPGAGVDPALALGVMRQESSFDPAIVSPAGARGLMQLMPATAAATAQGLGIVAAPATLTADPALNVRIGTAYLRSLLDRYGGAIPLAVAAYNAGPGRVGEWLSANGDPRAGADPLDWIELIGFSETRNYVQRVIENTVIYRARRGEAEPHPLAAWLRSVAVPP